LIELNASTNAATTMMMATLPIFYMPLAASAADRAYGCR
jgi:hypothetical protein